MDRLFHHHERHLDTDLIERIEASGAQGGNVSAPKKSRKPPRDGDTYRQNGSHDISRWRAPARVFLNHSFSGRVGLNRSDRWTRARSYAQAREMSPSTEQVR